jgi:HK97 family phage prohead protease
VENVYNKALSDIDLTPTGGMVKEAKKGLAWRSEFGRGGTRVGISRARDIVNGKDMSVRTVKRMFSFFSRHEVDKKAEGFKPGEKGYPSNGRIAWALWGGDAGYSWSRKKRDQIKKEEDKEVNMENKKYTKALITDDLNEKGEFVFTASTANLDRENDIIKADGWMLDTFKDGGPLLWGHDQNKLPVGRVLWVKADDNKLIGKAKFNGTTQLSKDVEKLVRSGDLTGLSVGFRPMDMKMNNDGGRTFTKQELLEISVVNVPANPDAVIHMIKSLDIKSESVLDMLKPEKKETVDECIERKIPIILEENPTMGTEQAFVIAQEMCMESTVTDNTEGESKGCGCNETKQEKEEGCPMNEPECSNYKKNKSLPLIDLDELIKKVDSLNDKVDTLIKEKEDAEEKVETDLREKKIKILRRAVSNYLARKSNMEDI